MFEVGVVCMKLAGRDAGKQCVVVDVVDAHTVLVDGETRRRKSNVKHLEPTGKKVQIAKGASAAEIAKLANELGWTLAEKKGKKEKAAAPARKKEAKAKPVKATKPATEKAAKAPKKKE
jgi:large subunit ribosomal protein L14e